MNVTLITLSEAARSRWATALLCFAAFVTVTVGYMTYRDSQQMQTAAEELTYRQDIMYAALDSSVYPVVVVNHKGEIVVWNKATENLTGYTHEEIDKLGLETLMLDPASAAKHTQKMKAALSDIGKVGRVTVIHDNLRTKTGEIIPTRISVYIYQSRTGDQFTVARMNAESSITELRVGKP